MYSSFIQRTESYVNGFPRIRFCLIIHEIMDGNLSSTGLLTVHFLLDYYNKEPPKP